MRRQQGGIGEAVSPLCVSPVFTRKAVPWRARVAEGFAGMEQAVRRTVAVA